MCFANINSAGVLLLSLRTIEMHIYIGYLGHCDPQEKLAKNTHTESIALIRQHRTHYRSAMKSDSTHPSSSHSANDLCSRIYYFVLRSFVLSIVASIELHDNGWRCRVAVCQNANNDNTKWKTVPLSVCYGAVVSSAGQTGHLLSREVQHNGTDMVPIVPADRDGMREAAEGGFRYQVVQWRSSVKLEARRLACEGSFTCMLGDGST